MSERRREKDVVREKRREVGKKGSSRNRERSK